jgi:regulator of chromosome condensation
MAPKKATASAPKGAKQITNTAATKKAAGGKQPNGVKKPAAQVARKKAATTKKATSTNSKQAAKKEPAATKTTAATIKAPAMPAKADKVATSKKRRAEDEVEHDEPKANTSKRRKGSDESAAPAPPPKRAIAAAKKPKLTKPKVIINHAPTRRLDIFVSGEGSQGELGLGAGKGSMNALRPRLNPHLSAAEVGVVQLATGGMHCAALTHDNKILTWGVNDEGALGRDTQWEGGLVDVDENKSDASSDDAELNPREATPTAVEFVNLPDRTIFTQVAAGDSSTFALTDEGQVYGWGTFRVSLTSTADLTNTDHIFYQGNDGILGFSPTTQIQRQPVLLSGLKKVTKIAAGANHVLALGTSGAVFAWGAGQQHQLGRRIVQRSKLNGLVPREFGLPKSMTDIAAGDTHSFAIHKNGKVYTWGLNNYGQTGIAEGAGGDEAVILHPTAVANLQNKGKIVCIDGGQFHSIAVTENGSCLTWGRVDGFQTGLKLDTLPDDDLIRDARNNPKILTMPTQVPGLDAVCGAAGTDYSIAVTRDGHAYSWGFGDGYRTGQGTDDDIEVARLMTGKAIAEKRIVWAGAGGQFSVLAGEAAPFLNGIA